MSQQDFDNAVDAADSRYRRLKVIGGTDVIQSFTPELSFERWIFQPKTLYENIVNSQCQFDVSVRNGVDLRSFALSFEFTNLTSTTRTTVATSLCSLKADLDSFTTWSAEKELQSNDDLIAAGNPGSTDTILPGGKTERIYVMLPNHLIESIQVYFNQSYVGTVPPTGTSLTFAEWYLLQGTIIGDCGYLPKPSTNILTIKVTKIPFC